MCKAARDLLLAEGSWKPGFGVIHGGERGLSRSVEREVFSDEGSGCRIREMARAAREKRRAKGGMTFMELRVVGTELQKFGEG